MPKKSLPAAPVTVVTTESPLDPAWEPIRKTAEQLRSVGRLFLRGQVKLGMQLAALKKQIGVSKGKGISTSPDSGKVASWADLVKTQTGYSRQSCDEFIRLYEATTLKLKKSKKLELPAAVKKSALVLFQDVNALQLTEEQWVLVDDVIGTLTTGETQSSLMQEMGLVPKPKPMPKNKGTGDGDDEGTNEEATAGQLAFHFFEAFTSPLVNARTSPDYKKLLLALPLFSDADHPLSLTTIESEIRATLADIEDAKQTHVIPTKGREIPA